MTRFARAARRDHTGSGVVCRVRFPAVFALPAVARVQYPGGTLESAAREAAAAGPACARGDVCVATTGARKTTMFVCVSVWMDVFC